MTNEERILIQLLQQFTDRNTQAVVLQSFIQEKGPLSEEAAWQVRTLLAKTGTGQ